jgi:hypothetical protein
MARPKGSKNTKNIEVASNKLVPLAVIIRAMHAALEPLVDLIIMPEMPTIPENWLKGALLNVRPTGDGYMVTLFPAEYDYRYPEKAMKFTHAGQCQDFVSHWYMRENQDPRA